MVKGRMTYEAFVKKYERLLEKHGGSIKFCLLFRHPKSCIGYDIDEGHLRADATITV